MSNFTWEFGPSFDRNDSDILPIAYIAIPNLTHERGIVKLASQRLFYGNYSHQSAIDLKLVAPEAEGYEKLSLHMQSSGSVFNGVRVGEFQTIREFDNISNIVNPFTIDFINQPIQIEGLEADITGRWRVLFKPGILCRKSSLYTSEPSGSWIRKTGIPEQSDVYYLYGIPEYWYGPTYGGFNSTAWSASDYSGSLRTEILNPTTSFNVRVNFTPILGVEAVWVNGTFLASGFWDGSTYSDLVYGVDSETGVISFKRSFAPTDEITIQYYTPREDYSFGGFYTPSSGYFHLDLNPEDGHFVRDPDNGYYYPTRDVLANGIQFYLHPCAAFTLSGGLVTNISEYVPPEITETEFTSGLMVFRFHGLSSATNVRLTGNPYYNGNYEDYWTLLETATYPKTIAHLNDRPLGNEDNVMERYIGYLKVPKSGNYQFSIWHDESVRMWILPATDLPPVGDTPSSSGSWWHTDWTAAHGATKNYKNSGHSDIVNGWNVGYDTWDRITSTYLSSGVLYPFRIDLHNVTNNGEIDLHHFFNGVDEHDGTKKYFFQPTSVDDSFTVNPVTQAATVSGIMQFYSAFDYGETHFLRYQLGANNDEIIQEIDPNTDEYLSQDTWGHGQFGLAKYREYGSFEPSWNANFPSSIPLGRLMSAPPVSIETVRVADVRQRGGGISDSLQNFYSQSGSGLIDRVAGFWDMSLWEGPTVKEGGSVQVTLPAALLNDMTETEIRALVMKRVPPGIELLLTFSGTGIV